MNPETPELHAAGVPKSTNEAASRTTVAPATPPASPKKKKSYWWVWVLLLALVGGGAYLWYPRVAEGEGQTTKKGKDDKGGGRAVPVVASTARQGEMPVYLNGLGSVTAFNTVTVRSRVDGQIIKVAFTEGQLVKEG